MRRQPASVSASLRYQVTFVARSCDSYADVMANRVRDDRMEAASAPGAATRTRTARRSIRRSGRPTAAAAALPGWHFSLGPRPGRRRARCRR